ncbi:MAG: hypothetical protein ACLR23_23535 [Clostridia bacterium]
MREGEKKGSEKKAQPKKMPAGKKVARGAGVEKEKRGQRRGRQGKMPAGKENERDRISCQIPFHWR